MIGVRKARRAARMYYLECIPVARIAEKLDCRREDVLDVIDDPGMQQKYVDAAEKARRRLRLRAAAAADTALERQVELVNATVDSSLIAEQQRAAARVLRTGMAEEGNDGVITIRFEGGPIKLGMPTGRGYREDSIEHASPESTRLRFDGD